MRGGVGQLCFEPLALGEIAVGAREADDLAFGIGDADHDRRHRVAGQVGAAQQLDIALPHLAAHDGGVGVLEQRRWYSRGMNSNNWVRWVGLPCEPRKSLTQWG